MADSSCLWLAVLETWKLTHRGQLGETSYTLTHDRLRVKVSKNLR